MISRNSALMAIDIIKRRHPRFPSTPVRAKVISVPVLSKRISYLYDSRNAFSCIAKRGGGGTLVY